MKRLRASRFFPPAEMADSDGLVLLGGQLNTPWLLDAYGHGIFPWPVFENDALLAWWSPDPRAIMEFDDVIVSRRLKRTCRTGKFTVSSNRDFTGVLRGCATSQDRSGNTWIVPSMMKAYQDLHAEGYAHSVEVWQGDRLVGGTYGVSIGGAFSAESKFYRVSDASKIALVALIRHLQRRGFELLDIQQLTEHSQRLGATEIPRQQFLHRLSLAQQLPVSFGDTLEVAVDDLSV
ncbi:MAG: leucyl/phenylalanyl-tRNA--protein transferase [Pirellulales bacterium]